MLPVWAVAAALLSQATWAAPSKLSRFAAVAVLTGYVVTNARGLTSTNPGQCHQNLQARLQSSIPDSGGTVQDWITSNIPLDAVVTASCGQATGYVLGRPVLSLVDRRYTRQDWNDTYLVSAMNRFHSHWLILYPHAACAFEQRDWPNLERLASGYAAPGLSVAVHTSDVTILRRKL